MAAKKKDDEPIRTVDARRFHSGPGRYASVVKDQWALWAHVVECLHKSFAPFEGKFISTTQLSGLPLKNPVMAALITIKRYVKAGNLPIDVRPARDPDTNEKGILISGRSDRIT
jgi:hypothetical protein